MLVNKQAMAVSLYSESNQYAGVSSCEIDDDEDDWLFRSVKR